MAPERLDAEQLKCEHSYMDFMSVSFEVSGVRRKT